MGQSQIVRGHVGSIARGINVPNSQPDRAGLASVNPIFTWVRLAQRIPVRIHIDKVPDGVRLGGWLDGHGADRFSRPVDETVMRGVHRTANREFYACVYRDGTPTPLADTNAVVGMRTYRSPGAPSGAGHRLESGFEKPRRASIR